MKYLYSFSLLFLLFFGMACAQEAQFPEAGGYLNDFAGVIGPDAASKINQICKDVDKTTGAQIAVVLVNSTEPLDSKTYAVKLFEKWKIGKLGSDNGVLFLLAVSDRRVEIEVGYGLEGVINDAKAGEILDASVIPYLKNNQTSEAILNGTIAIAETIKKGYLGEKKETGAPINISFLFAIFVLVILIAVITKSDITSLVGGFLGAIFGFFYMQSIIGILIGAVIGFLFGRGGGIMGGGMFGGFGGFGGGSGEGGFGGFGGGRSGGGGAGRSF